MIFCFGQGLDCPLPEIDLGKDRIICSGKILTLNAYYPEANYNWQDGSNDAVFTVSGSGSYRVTVQNACGTYSDSVNVIYRNFDTIIIPNIITPNGDDINEYFETDARLLGANIKILNRWGKTVFQSNDYRNTWKGDNLSTGIYYYLIKNYCENEKLKGWFHLLR